MLDNPDPKAGRLIKVAKSLTVNTPSNGTVTGTADSVSAINCPGDCAESAGNTAAIVLTANPASGYNLSSWSGVTCSEGNNTSTTCSFSMNNSAQTVTASFAAATVSYALNVTSPTNGTITSGTGAISCGSTCTASYTSGTSVTLTANPASGYAVDTWGGDCASATGTTCTLSMSAKHGHGPSPYRDERWRRNRHQRHDQHGFQYRFRYRLWRDVQRYL